MLPLEKRDGNPVGRRLRLDPPYLAATYKAETNFVDVVPQAKRLRLSLNVAFHEISDPKGLCKDVSGLGRWGNGDGDSASRIDPGHVWKPAHGNGPDALSSRCQRSIA
ncbi:MAG: hypothetical protein ACLQU5_31670 [Isosphaeraceae bacterium]